MNSKLRNIFEERKLIYNCSVNTFNDEGVSVLEVESLRGKKYFTLASFGKHLFLRIDPEMETPFDKEDISRSKKSVEVFNYIEDYYASSNKRSLEKTYCYYYYLSDELLVNHSNLVIKELSNTNNMQLSNFLNKLSEKELELADIELDQLDPVIFGGFSDSKMVGYVSHRYPNGSASLGEIGIVIDAEYRKKGFGKAMLIHEVNWCVKNKVVPMYVVLDENKASVSLVQKLGFEKVCEIYRLK